MPNYESLPPQRAVISESTAATNELVAAVTGKKIVVLNYAIVATAAVGVNFESATTDISGVMQLGANGGIAHTDNEFGLFETAAGAALAMTSDAAVQVSGYLTYVVV